jgi:Mg-chelatase subunit ChlD
MRKSKKTTKKQPRVLAVDNKPTLVVFLLDRSGSMQNCKQETIGGFNGYLEELSKDADKDMRFTMSQFDTVGHDRMCDFAKLGDVKKLDDKSFQPRGGTPLYDAIGKSINDAAKQAGSKYKVLFVTLTDGQENSSSEFNLDTARALIKEKEDKDHWTFAYIGMGLEGFEATSHLSKGTKSASNIMRSSKAHAPVAYASFAVKTKQYAKSARAGGQSVNCMWTTDIK